MKKNLRFSQKTPGKQQMKEKLVFQHLRKQQIGHKVPKKFVTTSKKVSLPPDWVFIRPKLSVIPMFQQSSVPVVSKKR